MTAGTWARDAILRLLDADAPAGLREKLAALADDHTLVLTGDVLSVERTSPGAPRLIADRRVVVRPRADVEALAAALTAAAGAEALRGSLVLIAGLGDGALARAVAVAGAVGLTVEVEPAAVAGDLVRVDSLEGATRETSAGRSAILTGNIVGLAEAMVGRGFTPDFVLDATGDGRVPEGYAPVAARVLRARNPLELARVQLQSRERLMPALRALGERGAVPLACPRDDRFDWLTPADGADASTARPSTDGFTDLLARGLVRAPVALRFERRGAGTFGALLDAARGAAYVDLAGGAIIVADSPDAATLGIKRWTSGSS